MLYITFYTFIVIIYIVKYIDVDSKLFILYFYYFYVL